MPSSCSSGNPKFPAESVERWQPFDFGGEDSSKIVRSVPTPPAQKAKPFESLLQFVESVQLTNINEGADSWEGEKMAGGGNRIPRWNPEELQPIYGVTGNTHDHLQSRQIRRQAEELLHRSEVRAQEIIAEAHRQAEQILADAQVKINEMYRQAYADGQAAANAEAQAMLQAARSIVDEVQAWKEAMFEQGEMMMLRLVIEIAQTIFGDGLPLDPDTLGQAFSRALSQAKSLGNLRVYVHPEDAAVLTAHWNKLQSSVGAQQIELVPSEVIKRGGCYIDGQFGTVDARVETQFQIAKETLLTTLQKTAQGVNG